MGIEYENDKMDELVRLTRENNKMLHAMRRNAWLGGIFRLLMWAAFLIVPFWFYLQYLAPLTQQAYKTLQQVQGTSASAQAKMSGLEQTLNKLQQMYGGGKTTP